jgi:hypothetical protein
MDGVRQAEGRPPVALLTREGDPSASVAVAVLTAGVDSPHGAEVAVALAAVVESRLAGAGLAPLSVVPGAEGFRVRLLLAEKGEAQGKVVALRNALLTPVTEGGPEMALVLQKLAALARRPLPDPMLDAAAACTGDPYAVRASAAPGTAATPLGARTLEAWRLASHGLGRVAFGAVGPAAELDAIATAVAESPAWPAGIPVVTLLPPASPDLGVYDAAAFVPAGAARVSLVLGTLDGAQAVLAAEALGEPQSPLAKRLEALDPLARIREVTGTAHVGWGCLQVTLDLPAPDGSGDPPVTLALATDLAKEELLATLTHAKSLGAVVRDIANQASDPRDAAERLAYWTLVSRNQPATAPLPAMSTVIGMHLAESLRDTALDERRKAIRSELDRAAAARNEPVGEMRLRVERGQSSLWVLVASPCGTETETDGDAGTGLLGITALAAQAGHPAGAAQVAQVAQVEEWASNDGLGLVVHASPLAGESGSALARRVGSLTAQAFGAALSDARGLSAARGLRLSSVSHDDARVFEALADAISPGHPSWILPGGTTEGLERSSDETVRARLDALRMGPLRIAVLADQDASQGDIVLQTLGAWLPRMGHRSPTCAPLASPLPPRPGTYAVETAGATGAEAWLAFALPPDDPPSRAAASELAAALNARGGLLERALGSGLARSWGAKVVGPTRAPVIAVRITSAQGSLDAAVAETRVLFDRLRQEGVSESDRTLAIAELTQARKESSLDPKARLGALWRGETTTAPPTMDAVRAFAARTLRDEALIIVASRPPRTAASKLP